MRPTQQSIQELKVWAGTFVGAPFRIRGWGARGICTGWELSKTGCGVFFLTDKGFRVYARPYGCHKRPLFSNWKQVEFKGMTLKHVNEILGRVRKEFDPTDSRADAESFRILINDCIHFLQSGAVEQVRNYVPSEKEA